MTSQKAFIFDMDGVMINSEIIWKKIDPNFLHSFFGHKIGNALVKKAHGSDINSIYKWAEQLGFKGNKSAYVKAYDDLALTVYSKAVITPGLEELFDKLISLNFKLGLVSSSRQNWIDQVLKKIPQAFKFKVIISLNDSPNLKPKPHPDGYLLAIKKLSSTPESTIILEDSNPGIKSAKASGAKTICLLENQPSGYQPTGADIYIDTIKALTLKIESFLN